MNESNSTEGKENSVGAFQAGNRERLSIEEALRILRSAGATKVEPSPDFGGIVFVGMGVSPENWDDEDQDSSDEKKSKKK